MCCLQRGNAVNVNGYLEEQDDDEVEVSVLFNNFVIAFSMFKWIVLILTVIGILVGLALASFVYKPLYSTSATFTIAPKRTSENNYGFNTFLDDQIVVAETYVITGTTLKEMLIEKLGENYSNCEITAETLKNTNLITVTVTADSKAKAYVALERIMLDFPNISNKIFGDVSVSLLDELEVSDTAINAGTKKSYILFSGLGGLLIGFAVIFVYSLNLNLVSDPETLQRYVNTDCLGKIPSVLFKNRKQESFVAINNRNISDDFKEAFQFLRTRTERFSKQNNHRTFLVTSTFPGEGKTAISTNLALSLSQNQKSVVIVDADLRNPSVLKRLGIKHNKFGLDDYLNGKCKLEDAFVRYPRTDIFMLSCIKSMPNASEMINSEIMAHLMEKVKRIADYVIIDSPPTDIISDSIALAKYSDASIFVVRQNYGKINNVIYAIESIKQTDAELIGFVLNDSHIKSKVSSNHGSYSNYSYNYFGNKRKSEASNGGE